MGRKKKQFCPRGHDTFRGGRYKNGCCRECTYLATRQWSQENRELVNLQARERTARHPERARRASRDWRERHPERYNRYLKHWLPQWREENRDHIRVYDRGRYGQKRAHILQRQRARQQKCPPMLMAETEEILTYYGRRCVYCGKAPTGFDHLYPLARGGEHTVANQAPACIDCNRSKNDRPVWVMLGRANG